MLQLALLAALLMAFAPSITRWMASEGPQVLAGWTELCTTEGIQWIDTRAELLFPRLAGDAIASVVTLPRARRLRLRGLGGQGPPVLL